MRPFRWVVTGILGALGVVLAMWLAIPPSNARAKAANDAPRFSVRIRDGLPRMAPTAGRKG